MELEILRLKRYAEDIEKHIYPSIVPIDSFKIYEGKSKQALSMDSTLWAVYKTSENWVSKGKHRWFKTIFNVPESFVNRKLVFQIITGREGQWDACNPQFLFYKNGQLIQGCDVNHREICLTECAEKDEQIEIAFLAYGGTQGDDLVIKANIAVVDEETQALYYDFKNPLDTLELIFSKDVHHKIQLLKGLEAASDVLDLRSVYSDAYYASVKEARAVLKRYFYSEESLGPTVFAVGNTHIDIAWLWTVDQTREKVIRSYATVIELMDKYPDYKFLGSQAILYQFVKDQEPELYEKIKEKIKLGQWEVDGGMWLEADCNIPSGESLIRQILKGEKFYEKEFGIKSSTLWLPDVFGYSAALPQILNQFEIPYFLTTKIAWNQYNQLPNDTFMWRGLDGSEVFAFMPTTCDANKHLGNNISFTDTRNTTTYTGIIGANMTLGTYNRFQNKTLMEDTLMLYGYGDGGGGPTAEMLENAQRLKWGMPGIPKLKLSSNKTYLDKAYAEMQSSKDKPTWDGELYFEYHRGTLTSNGRVKKWNRKIELLTRLVEILTASNYMNQGIKIPKGEMDAIWDVLLLNQFHDIIPGTSIAEVYETANKQYEQVYEMGMQLLNQALASFVDKDANWLTVYNPHSFTVSDQVVFQSEKPVIFVRDDNELINVQFIGNNTYTFYAKDMPMLDFKSFEIQFENKNPVISSVQSAEDYVYQNAYYKVRFNKRGEIMALINLESGYMFTGNQPCNQLIAYEDRPANWDNWDVDKFYQRKPYTMALIEPLKIVFEGPVVTQLEVTFKMNASVLKQRINLYSDSARIEFEHAVHWQENNLLLRAEFPTAIRQNKAVFDIQFGATERETTNNHSWDLAKFETCAHKWVDYGTNSDGLSLLSDCKYGYSVKDGVMGLSLIKSGTYPNDSEDKGEHYYKYALYPHSGLWFNGGTIEQGECFNQSLIAVRGKKCIHEAAPIKIKKGHVMIDTIKLSEDGKMLLVRLHENQNTFSNVVLEVSQKAQTCFWVNLREEVVEAISLSNQTLNFNVKPFEIRSLGIVLNEEAL